jgi:hypothetical protein
MTKYGDLRVLYKQWSDRNTKWENVCTPIPYELSEALTKFLNAPTEPVRGPDGKLFPYVGVYFPNSVGDFVKISPKDGLPHEDGWWKFYLGVLLERAPGESPKKCVTIPYHFVADSPDHLTFKIEHLSGSFDIDMKTPEGTSKNSSRQVATNLTR